MEYSKSQFLTPSPEWCEAIQANERNSTRHGVPRRMKSNSRPLGQPDLFLHTAQLQTPVAQLQRERIRRNLSGPYPTCPPSSLHLVGVLTS